ncbi:MAG: asparagine synthase (glutamine-hydrolyzing) [Gemmatimonadota bacterium]|nr:asparagine synthase (glutamine-hydrolyzing) [Gemmatimonadota bacterium]
MCGLVGVVSRTAWKERPPLVAMRDCMQHRGPDDAGVWWSPDGRVGLAHRRLSILDLSPLGHQPMFGDEQRVAIVFNGEIYNFAELKAELERLGFEFRSHSDTEVIINAYRAWGSDCVRHLRGMFAFAVYDAANARLFMARDRAGEKPFFYALSGNELRFASELKSLLADPSVPRVMDPQALDAYLAFGYVPAEQCLVAGIRKLAPATTGTFDLTSGAFSTESYWHLPSPPECEQDVAQASETELVDKLDALLEASVREQLVADVPVGVLLSGGIDSSLVVAMAARVSSKPVRTFTIAFPGHGAFDEGPYAQIVAKHFKTEHHELVAEPASLDLLPSLVHQFDEPIADSSMLPTFLVSRLIQPHCKVALGGDGGDELFGGYKLYQVVLAQQALRRKIPGLFRGPLGAAANMLPIGFRGRTYARAIALDPLEAVAQTGLYFDQPTRAGISPLLRGSEISSPGEALRTRLATGVIDTLQQLTRADFSSYMCDDVLVKVDRASMLASLEVRAPFLDQRIIEFAFSMVPREFRTSLHERKILPKRLAKRLLPSALDLNRKRGFSIPLAEWFRGDWGKYIEGVLLNAPVELLDRAMVAKLFQGQRRGLNNAQRLFALAMLELWRREYNIDLPDRSSLSVGMRQ